MTQNYQVPMKCVKPGCPNWYFGWWPHDENKLCLRCRDERADWLRITIPYLKETGKPRL
jgi:hypothetical protein